MSSHHHHQPHQVIVLEPNPYHTRKLILQLIQYISDRHFTLLPSLFHHSATWTMIASPPDSSYGGTMLARDFLITMEATYGGFDTFSMDVLDLIVEGNRGVANVVTRGEGPGKEKYDNELFLWVELDERGERIRSVKNSMDAHRVQRWTDTRAGREMIGMEPPVKTGGE